MAIYLPFALEDNDIFGDGLDNQVDLNKKMCKGLLEQHRRESCGRLSSMINPLAQFFEDLEEEGVQTGNDAFRVELSAHGYKPDEIVVEIKSGDRLLMVSGKQEQKDTKGNVTGMKQFARSFIVPEDYSLKEIKSSLCDGVVQIMAPKLIQNGNDMREQAEFVQDSAAEFAIEVDVTGYDPEDLNLEMHGNGNVVLSAKHDEKTENGVVNTKEFSKSFTLPENADLSGLKSKFSKEKILRITAPMKPQKNINLPVSVDIS